jgi:hypothetical protein
VCADVLSTETVPALFGTTFFGGAENLNVTGHKTFTGCMQDITMADKVLVPADIATVAGTVEKISEG